jgi:hypothetical protein
MPSKSHTLIPYHLRDHNIQSWRKSFLPLPKGDSSLLGFKRTTFLSRYEMCLFGFLFLGELGTCPQNLAPTQRVEPWENHQFPQGGMLKFTYKGCFLTIKIAYEKFLDWKSEQWKHALVPPLHVEILIFEKHQNQDFWWYFKVLSLARFWQFWVVLGRFCCIDSGWEHGIAQTWAKILKTS